MLNELERQMWQSSSFNTFLPQHHHRTYVDTLELLMRRKIAKFICHFQAHLLNYPKIFNAILQNGNIIMNDMMAMATIHI